MADTIKLTAETRTEFGKGAARRLRRDSKIPAVLYGHGADPVHIALEGHETLLALRNANALLSIDIKGEQEQLALPKQVQRDPIKGFIEHVDLLIVRRGEKVEVEIPLSVVGEAGPDTLVVVEAAAVLIKAEATDIPEGIEVSVEGLEAGSQITLGELSLPEGVEIVGDLEALAVNVTNAPVEVDLGDEDEEAEGEESAQSSDSEQSGDDES